MPAEQTAILATLAGFTLGHVLFLAVHLWIKNTRSEASGYLTLLLLCMAVRVTKSVLMLIFPGFVFENILIALGVIAMAAIGPLIWLYIGKSLIANAPFKPRMLVHFVPGILLSYFAFVLNDAQMFLVYQVTVYLIATYILFTVITVARGRRVIPVATFTWIKEFLVACVVITVIFGIQLYTTSFRLYMGVSIAAAAVLYTISLRASVIKQPFHSPDTMGRESNSTPFFSKKCARLLLIENCTSIII